MEVLTGTQPQGIAGKVDIMLQTTAELIERRIDGASQTLRLYAPTLARRLSPGQPVLIKTGWGLQPYLRRTLYPIAIDHETWVIRLPASGDWGHAWLRAAPLGAQLDCLGPVGRGYRVPAGGRNLLLIGEGEQTWTLLPAVQQAAASGLVATLAMQAATARELIPADRLPEMVEYRVATLDGTRGHSGALSPILPELVAWAEAVLAAGSLAFYAALADAIADARFGLRPGFAQALYPAAFLCGYGACQACAADVAGGRRRVCLRGPVFDLVDLSA